RKPAHHRVISYLNVATQRAVIRKDDAVAHGAIVTDMAVGEEVSAITDSRFAFARCAAMRRHEFTKRIFVADFQISRFAAILKILRLLADGAVRVEPVLCSSLHRPAERDVMLEPAVWADHNVVVNNTVGPYDRSCTDFGAWIDNGGRMNPPVAHLSRNVNISSASETIASFTTQ